MSDLPFIFFADFYAKDDATQCKESDNKEEDEGRAILHITGVFVLRNFRTHDINVIGQCHDALEEKVSWLF